MWNCLALAEATLVSPANCISNRNSRASPIRLKSCSLNPDWIIKTDSVSRILVLALGNLHFIMNVTKQFSCIRCPIEMGSGNIINPRWGWSNRTSWTSFKARGGVPDCERRTITDRITCRARVRTWRGNRGLACCDCFEEIALQIRQSIINFFLKIRRDLAQGVSDHRLFMFIATFVMSVK